MHNQQNNQPRRSVILSLVFVVAIVVTILGAVSAVFGIGSAVFNGKWGNLQITTTSVGLVLVIVGFLFLFYMTRLILTKVSPPDDAHFVPVSGVLYLIQHTITIPLKQPITQVETKPDTFQENTGGKGSDE
jgi:protein-S-isoprenylcysteine O-methyltransferase Ste14